jgi:hypothetical protein
MTIYGQGDLEMGCGVLYVCIETLLSFNIFITINNPSMKILAEPFSPYSPRVAENALEFGRAAAGSRLLYAAFGQLLRNRRDPQLAGRLHKRMLRVIQSDTCNGRGERQASCGDVTLLERFDFFNRKPMHRVLYAPFQASIERRNGLCRVVSPPFDARHCLGYRFRYTHVSFVACAAVLDFERDHFTCDVVRSDYQDIRQPVQLSLQARIPVQTNLPVVFVMGVELLQAVNGRYYCMGADGPLSLQVVQCAAGALAGCSVAA